MAVTGDYTLDAMSRSTEILFNRTYCSLLNDGDPERAKFLSPRFGMGHGHHDVSLAHQLGEQ